MNAIWWITTGCSDWKKLQLTKDKECTIWVKIEEGKLDHQDSTLGNIDKDAKKIIGRNKGFGYYNRLIEGYKEFRQKLKDTEYGTIEV